VSGALPARSRTFSYNFPSLPSSWHLKSEPIHHHKYHRIPAIIVCLSDILCSAAPSVYSPYYGHLNQNISNSRPDIQANISGWQLAFFWNGGPVSRRSQACGEAGLPREKLTGIFCEGVTVEVKDVRNARSVSRVACFC
jgi:hypothetical protein